MQKYYLYQIKNLLNGKLYIGITKNPAKRWWTHQNCSRKTAIASAIQKYGPSEFQFKILVIGSRDYITKLESIIILNFNTKAPIGYNLTDGGEGTHGYKPTKEATRKRLETCKGRKLSELHKQKIGRAHRGKFVSTETRNKIRRANLRRFSNPEEIQKLSLAHLGKKTSKETKLKIRQSAKRGDKHPNAKRIKIDGVQYGCIKLAAKALQIHESTLFRRLKSGKYSEHYKYV